MAKKKGIGHNSGAVESKRLKSIIERIERLEEEKKSFADDIKQVYAEAKGAGFDAPTIRRIIRLRKMEPEKIREQEELLDLYMGALGMLTGTPLANAALEREEQK
ncbi:MAG: DUF2312 domain-containing protein [Alphaproteobacteria bacterium]